MSVIILVTDHTWAGIQYNITLRTTSRPVSGRPTRLLFMLLNGKKRTGIHVMDRAYFHDLPSGSEGWFVFNDVDIGGVCSFLQGLRHRSGCINSSDIEGTGLFLQSQRCWRGWFVRGVSLFLQGHRHKRGWFVGGVRLFLQGHRHKRGWFVGGVSLFLQGHRHKKGLANFFRGRNIGEADLLEGLVDSFRDTGIEGVGLFLQEQKYWRGCLISSETDI